MRLAPLLLVLFVVHAKDDDDSYEDTTQRAVKKTLKWRGDRGRPSRASPRPQFAVNCPEKCKCNTTSISCRNTDYSGQDIFMQMQPRAFPSLDTLIFTGNRIGPLTSPSLFASGEERIHKKLSLVNLTDNRITKISSDALMGMPSVEYLYLGDNLLSHFDDPFARLQKLRHLEMKGAFKKEAKPRPLPRLFKTSLPMLDTVDLSGNGLSSIPPDSFCELPALARLILSHNSINGFAPAKSCAQGIKHLDLSHNSLSEVDDSLWEVLPQIQALDISANPLQCTCDFVKLAQRERDHFLNQQLSKCANLDGAVVFDVDVSLVCSSPSSGWLGKTLLLVVVCSCLFLGWRRWGRWPLFHGHYEGVDGPQPHFSFHGDEQAERSPSPSHSIFENPLYSYQNPAFTFPCRDE